MVSHAPPIPFRRESSVFDVGGVCAVWWCWGDGWGLELGAVALTACFEALNSVGSLDTVLWMEGCSPSSYQCCCDDGVSLSEVVVGFVVLCICALMRKRRAPLVGLCSQPHAVALPRGAADRQQLLNRLYD